MRVVVNALPHRTGGNIPYLIQQLQALSQVRPDFELRLLTAPWNVEQLRAALDLPLRLIRVRSVATRFLYEQTTMALALRGANLLYCPGNFAPLFPPLPTVVAMRNMYYFGRGRRLRRNIGLRRRIELTMARLSLRRAHRVVVVSNSLLAQIRSDGLPTDRCRVVRTGAPSWPQESRIPTAFGTKKGYVLALGNDYPHKRFQDIVHAWRSALADRSAPPALVVAGRVSTARRRVHERVAGSLASHLIFLGEIRERAEVKGLLEGARVLVSASELEAFPMTPAEAGSLGCPVILSDIPEHREVAGEHATYFPVGDAHALTKLLHEQCSGPARRHEWRWPIEWDDHARALGRVFDEAVARRRGR